MSEEDQNSDYMMGDGQVVDLNEFVEKVKTKRQGQSKMLAMQDRAIENVISEREDEDEENLKDSDETMEGGEGEEDPGYKKKKTQKPKKENAPNPSNSSR